MKAKSALTFLLLMGLLISISTTANEKEVKPAGKTYTQAELDKMVMEELEKKMKKIGRSKMIDFSKSLLKKEEDLRQKEFDLKKREEKLSMSEKTLKGKIEEFKGTQSKFIACLDDVDNKEKGRIDHMVSVVSGMRPQNAADLLSQQEPEISVKIISELDPTKTSKIFNLMDKEISARLQKLYLKMQK